VVGIEPVWLEEAIAEIELGGEFFRNWPGVDVDDAGEAVRFVFRRAVADHLDLADHAGRHAVEVELALLAAIGNGNAVDRGAGEFLVEAEDARLLVLAGSTAGQHAGQALGDVVDAQGGGVVGEIGAGDDVLGLGCFLVQGHLVGHQQRRQGFRRRHLLGALQRRGKALRPAVEGVDLVV
jgi:hypothetical protein